MFSDRGDKANRARVYRDRQDRRGMIAEHVRHILTLLGDDAKREGLQDTPMRVAKAYEEMFSGYGRTVANTITTFDNEGYDTLILLTDIPFASTCEHHVLPFTGHAHIGYIPDDRIVGLSKLPRIVDIFARRLQVQERLTTEIANAIQEALKPVGVIVVIEAQHSCMSLRGVKTHGVDTITSSVKGCMMHDPAARSEALSLITNRRPNGGTA